MKNEHGKFSQQQVQACIDMLDFLTADSKALALLSDQQRLALLIAAGKFSRPSRDEMRQRKRERIHLKKKNIDSHERTARASTGIRQARSAPVFNAPEPVPFLPSQAPSAVSELIHPRACYICKNEFTRLHFFYDALCPSCAQFNYAKRFQTVPLIGQVALITGSRLKIGYQASLMMLRAGAKVIATTRFPVDCASRYAREKDFSQWKSRLHIYGLDLRHTPSVELFCKYVEGHYPRLDILINNAAQTVRRPPGFYAHLMALEMRPFDQLDKDVQALLEPFEACKQEFHLKAPQRLTQSPTPAVAWSGTMPGIGLSASAKLSQIPYTHDQALSEKDVFPQGKLDADLQQVDLRPMNSWRLALGQIPTAEMIELQLVNAIAPFVLCNHLLTMMKRENTGQKHIVNVSAMEGKFHRFTKTDKHPHTNMAKAALNMLTHTSAKDLVTHGIHMNAVDTGWVTDEDPAALMARKQDNHDFQPPLDIVDGAARVCDPFFHGIQTGQHWSGKFLKDYFPVDW